MKIALIGYGKMGQLIEQIAGENGHLITARFSKNLGMPSSEDPALKEAEIVFDFSNGHAVLDHLDLCLSLKKPLLIGTTGWEEHFETAKEKVKNLNGSCLYSPNFSLGIHLFHKLISYTASLLEPFEEYDAAGIEYHHRKKVDAPSGTAKMLRQSILEKMPRLNDVNFSSVRCGHFPGTHTLLFDSPTDTLTLSHEARSRDGFAKGALSAGEWLLKKRGFFTLSDMVDEMMQATRKG